ncbi:hypothetical protein ACFSTC_06315 [Nonomuraea ferruginea]
MPGLLTEIFAQRLGRPVTADDLGMPAAATPLDLGQEFTHTWQEGVATVTALWRADVERRRFLLDSTFAIGAGSVGAVRWLTSPPEGRPSAAGARRVGRADIAAIHEVTRSFGELDNRFGSGRVRSSVVRYLDTAVTPLLKDGSYGDKTGRELAAAAAELTRLVGWMAYDLEQHGLAQRYLIQALRLARGSDDHALGGEILAGMAHQAIYMGQHAHALDLARAAQLSARRAGVATLLASSHVLEAHAHAGLGDARACGGALHEAERAFDVRKPCGEPPWLGYFERGLPVGQDRSLLPRPGGGRAHRTTGAALARHGRPLRARPHVQPVAAGRRAAAVRRAGGSLLGGARRHDAGERAAVGPLPHVHGRPAQAAGAVQERGPGPGAEGADAGARGGLKTKEPAGRAGGLFTF